MLAFAVKLPPSFISILFCSITASAKFISTPLIVVVPLPITPVVNVVEDPERINLLSFKTSMSTLFVLSNITPESSTVPELVIIAFPVLLLNSTFVNCKFPLALFTFIASLKPSKFTLLICNVYSSVVSPSAFVVLFNILLLPFIFKFPFNSLFIVSIGSSIHFVK